MSGTVVITGAFSYTGKDGTRLLGTAGISTALACARDDKN
jgi:hypothetical protein